MNVYIGHTSSHVWMLSVTPGVRDINSQ